MRVLMARKFGNLKKFKFQIMKANHPLGDHIFLVRSSYCLKSEHHLCSPKTTFLKAVDCCHSLCDSEGPARCKLNKQNGNLLWLDLLLEKCLEKKFLF